MAGVDVVITALLSCRRRRRRPSRPGRRSRRRPRHRSLRRSRPRSHRRRTGTGRVGAPVEAPPQLDAVERAGLDVGEQGAGPGQLGLDQRRHVLVLHHEQAGQAELLDPGPLVMAPGQLEGQAVAARPQDGGGVGRGEDRQVRQPRLEPEVLLVRDAQQLPQPVDELVGARVGDAIDGPLGALALAAGLLGLDQPLAPHHLHHGVEGPVIELDAVPLAPGPHGRRHFVGVHGPLVEAGQCGQGQGVRHGTALHVGRPLLVMGYPVADTMKPDTQGQAQVGDRATTIPWAALRRAASTTSSPATASRGSTGGGAPSRRAATTAS